MSANPLAIAALGPIAGSLFGKKRRHPTTGTNTGTFAGGTANFYDDTLGQVSGQLQKGDVEEGGGAAGSLAALLKNYLGDAKSLQDWVGRLSPFIASSLAGTPAFKALQDFASNSDLVSSFGSIAGQTAKGVTEGKMRGEQQLAEAGLGRSAARSSLASGAAISGGAADSDTFSRLYQAQQQQRQQFATQAFDAHRMIGQIALGSNPAPQQGSSNPWIPLAGAGIGAAGNILAALV